MPYNSHSLNHSAQPQSCAISFPKRAMKDGTSRTFLTRAGEASPVPAAVDSAPSRRPLPRRHRTIRPSTPLDTASPRDGQEQRPMSMASGRNANSNNETERTLISRIPSRAIFRLNRFRRKRRTARTDHAFWLFPLRTRSPSPTESNHGRDASRSNQSDVVKETNSNEISSASHRSSIGDNRIIVGEGIVSAFSPSHLRPPDIYSGNFQVHSPSVQDLKSTAIDIEQNVLKPANKGAESEKHCVSGQPGAFRPTGDLGQEGKASKEGTQVPDERSDTSSPGPESDGLEDAHNSSPSQQVTGYYSEQPVNEADAHCEYYLAKQENEVNEIPRSRPVMDTVASANNKARNETAQNLFPVMHAFVRGQESDAVTCKFCIRRQEGETQMSQKQQQVWDVADGKNWPKRRSTSNKEECSLLEPRGGPDADDRIIHEGFLNATTVIINGPVIQSLRANSVTFNRQA